MARKNFPTRVTRGSCAIFGKIHTLTFASLAISCSYIVSAAAHPYHTPGERCVHILRNFTNKKGCLFLPILVCIYKTGHGESNFMAAAMSNKKGLKTMSRSNAHTTSQPRLTTRRHPLNGELLHEVTTSGHIVIGTPNESSKK